VVLAVAAAAAGGCMTFPDEIDSVERQVARLRQDITGMARSSDAARGMLEERVSQLEGGAPRPAPAERAERRTEPEGSAADLNERLHQLLDEFRVLQGKLEEQTAALDALQRRVDRLELSRGGGAPRSAVAPAPVAPPVAPLPPVVTPAPPPRPAAPPPTPVAPPAAPSASLQGAAVAAGGEETYRNALGDYTRGNYDLALQGFRSYLQRSPGGPQAANAQYWLAETYYSQRDYARAVEEFKAVVHQHADSPKAPSALFKQGQAYMNLGDARQATAAFCDLLSRYPRTREAQLARERNLQCR
jgi:tol-pal system protein YbgF